MSPDPQTAPDLHHLVRTAISKGSPAVTLPPGEHLCIGTWLPEADFDVEAAIVELHGKLQKWTGPAE